MGVCFNGVALGYVERCCHGYRCCHRYIVEEWQSGFHENSKKKLFIKAQYSPGALSPFTQILVILGNAARCASLKIPQNASEDNICVLFFHVVLSTEQPLPSAGQLTSAYNRFLGVPCRRGLRKLTIFSIHLNWCRGGFSHHPSLNGEWGPGGPNRG